MCAMVEDTVTSAPPSQTSMSETFRPFINTSVHDQGWTIKNKNRNCAVVELDSATSLWDFHTYMLTQYFRTLNKECKCVRVWVWERGRVFCVCVCVSVSVLCVLCVLCVCVCVCCVCVGVYVRVSLHWIAHCNSAHGTVGNGNLWMGTFVSSRSRWTSKIHDHLKQQQQKNILDQQHTPIGKFETRARARQWFIMTARIVMYKSACTAENVNEQKENMNKLDSPLGPSAHHLQSCRPF